MSLRPAVRIPLLVLVAVAAACGSPTEPSIDPDPVPPEPAPDPPPPPVALVFTTSPTDAEGGAVAETRVAVVDSTGAVVVGSTAAVTVSLAASPTVSGREGALSGTVTVAAAGGVATFDDLVVDRPGRGYVLQASTPGLTSATSDPFDLTLTFSSIDAGDDIVCGLTPGGTWCWGRNSRGQLGAGLVVPFENQAVPVRVSGGHDFADVAVSNNYSSRVCGLTEAGAAYCWGDDRYGELGNGIEGFSRTAPTVVAGVVRFATLGLGRYHTCGVTPGGRMLCWGRNSMGEMGRGPVGEGSPFPVQVGSDDLVYVAVTGGRDHGCALDEDGAAYCWGDNRSDQLGAGPIGDLSASPVEVEGGLSFVGIDAGERHTCAWTAAGDGYCWGTGADGRLGDDNGSTSSDVPVLVAGGHAWRMIDTGTMHACGLTTDGAAYCWGRASAGQLGTGDGSTAPAEAPVAVAGGLVFESISAGEDLSCGRTADGSVYCWGQGTSGQLGDGTETSRDTPQRIVQG